jgi:hypothetical protein
VQRRAGNVWLVTMASELSRQRSCLPRIGNLISLFVIQNSHVVVFEMVSARQGRSVPGPFEAAQRILDGAAEGIGVLAPGEMFDAPSFLRALAPEYLTFESEAGR